MKYYMGMDIGGTSARLKIACEGKEPLEYVTKDFFKAFQGALSGLGGRDRLYRHGENC